MFGKKKTTGAATPVPQVSNKKKVEDYLTSMSFLSHFVIDKKESLVEEEIKTVREIDKVKDSYTDVIEHNASIREAVDSLQKEFGKIGEISRQFTDVITGVTVPVNTEKDLPLLQMKSQNFPLASKNWWVM